MFMKPQLQNYNQNKHFKILSIGQKIQIKIYSKVERVWGQEKSEM